MGPVGYIFGGSPLRLWGLSPQERLRRSLARAGVGSVAAADDSPPPTTQSFLLFRGDWVYDDNLVAQLVSRPETVLVGPDGQPVAVHAPSADWPQVMTVLQGGDADLPAHLARLDAVALGGRYNSVLRKREVPLLEKLDQRSVADVERRLFDGSYKGVTDFATKYLWPLPARIATKWCSLAGITPNQVTLVSLLFVTGAFWAFWRGDYGLGLALAWVMTFLDTVDGKLARVTLTSSKFGEVFDHGIDLLHPPFWWWAWLVSLGPAFDPQGFILAIIVAGYVLQRIEEGIFIKVFQIEIHIWRRFDSLFRLVTARRNPNLLILTASAIVGEPAYGILAVALWTALCLVVHTLRLLQAAIAARHGPLVSWLAQ